MSGGFEETDLYRDAQRLIRFIYGLEERFPEDDARSLYRPMRDLSLEIGARIAAGFSCLGDSIASMLPEENCREIRSKLGEVRHYVITAVERHHIDERLLCEFDTIYESMSVAVAGPNPLGDRGAGSVS